MIYIDSFLRDSPGKLVPLDQFSGDIDPTIDKKYDIEGSVKLSIDIIDIISKEWWTTIDILWGGLLQGVWELSRSKPFSFFFQGVGFISFSLRDPDRVLISVSRGDLN